jgi:hypothetical protein
MDTSQGHSWMEDCQRIIEEFNEVAVPAFRQEYGTDEDLLTIAMRLQPVQEDIQLDVGTRAVFLVERITGLVFKVGSNGRIREDKCIGHVSGISGRELYRWLWW